MWYTPEMCAPSQIDIYQCVQTENVPEVHGMIESGVVPVGTSAPLAVGLETEDVNDIGTRIGNEFEGIEHSMALAGMDFSAGNN